MNDPLESLEALAKEWMEMGVLRSYEATITAELGERLFSELSVVRQKMEAAEDELKQVLARKLKGSVLPGFVNKYPTKPERDAYVAARWDSAFIVKNGLEEFNSEVIRLNKQA